MEKKILFACDLDNTLFISHRNRQYGDVCVEWVNGKEQSFMTQRAIELLRTLQNYIKFVPVTTRSIEQYQRIKWPEGCEPCWAVTTNGAILLQNGQIDDNWSQDVKRIIDKWRGELQVQYERHVREKQYVRCRIVDASYLFLCCAEGIDGEAYIKKYGHQTKMTVEGKGKYFQSGFWRRYWSR